MKFTLPLVAAAAAFAFSAPLVATEPAEQAAEQPAGEPAGENEKAPVPIEIPAITPVEPSTTAEAAEREEEEEIICRSIRLDMSSRRKTRVCRTEEGWRQMNQQR